MANVTRNADWDVDVNPGENVSLFTAGTYVDKNINVKASEAGNGMLTIQRNGSNVATFTANQSTNTTANIVVPVLYEEVQILPTPGTQDALYLNYEYNTLLTNSKTIIGAINEIYLAGRAEGVGF